MLMAFTSFYCQPEVCVCANDEQSKSFYVDVGLQQGVLFHFFFFTIYVKWIDKLSQTN